MYFLPDIGYTWSSGHEKTELPKFRYNCTVVYISSVTHNNVVYSNCYKIIQKRDDGRVEELIYSPGVKNYLVKRYINPSGTIFFQEKLISYAIADSDVDNI
ncbi:hypothetical protein MBGDN05_00318 [Thermoplasmatales archaeon SCGC AB-539-N05]|nr:hypothetical protein MBGDN05_00318 [Thermoplasmatales archaeon SCGC AB-539-N05]